MKPFQKPWLIGIGVVLLLASFILTGSFWDTLQRRRAVKKFQAESRLINHKIQLYEQKVTRLSNDPAEMENLVRLELGYLRPGEKEVRFMERKRGR